MKERQETEVVSPEQVEPQPLSSVTLMMEERPESDSQVAAEDLSQVTAELWLELLLEVEDPTSQFARPVASTTNTKQREDAGPELEEWL